MHCVTLILVNMKTTKRFESAVMKLYNAFHENRLNAMDCTACAVGNLCNNTYYWTKIRNLGNSLNEDVEENVLLRLNEETGYSQKQLIDIEYVFMHGETFFTKQFTDYRAKINFHRGRFEADKSILKQQQFYALCAVIEYLCELDNIPNVMDYKSLFETENNEAKYSLETVFV